MKHPLCEGRALLVLAVPYDPGGPPLLSSGPFLSTMRFDPTPSVRRPLVATILLAASVLAGCSSVREWAGIRLFYDRAPAPASVQRDIHYLEGSDDPKHRLDLYLPEGRNWPVLIFVHGGGWTGGDKELLVSGADVYGNIGRFYATRGIGTAVINYRLQPAVTWREQVNDVARAAAWVHARIADSGGDPNAVFLSGHSAGAQLATYAALDSEPLAALELTPEIFCGVIPVSGVGYDLADQETYDLGAKPPYYEERFRAGDPGDGWLREASAISYLSSEAPPFLLIHGSKEWKWLAHQNRLLDQALRAAGVSTELRVAHQTHVSIVLALSSEKKLPAMAVLEFIRGSSCGQ